VQAAKWYGVAPWELEQVPNSLWWQLVGTATMKAEHTARQAKEKG